MGWLKAVGQGILWVAKNEAVRRIVIAFVRRKVAEKAAADKSEALMSARREADRADAELASAPRVVIQ